MPEPPARADRGPRCGRTERGCGADPAQELLQPERDVCYGIFKTGSVYSFRLTLAKKYFSRYQVCVRPLGQQVKCKSFPVKKTGASWGGTVVWQRNYPVSGPRGYRVMWRQGTTRLGPPLTFYLPAPI